MDKFEKKIRKILKHTENAVVVGVGFGNLPSILNTHKNVFILDHDSQTVKAKNLIYQENFDYLHVLTEIKVIYFDLDKIHLLDKLQDLWTRHRCPVIIEGAQPIERAYSKSLYKTHWECTSIEKHFHIWSKTK